MQANKENAEREFEVRSAEYMASFYTDLQDMIKRVADKKGLTYVVRYTNEPVSARPPNPHGPHPVSGRLCQSGYRHHADVLYNLNKEYIEKGGKVAKPPVAEGEAAPASAPPASVPRQAAGGTGKSGKK